MVVVRDLWGVDAIILGHSLRIPVGASRDIILTGLRPRWHRPSSPFSLTLIAGTIHTSPSFDFVDFLLGRVATIVSS